MNKDLLKTLIAIATEDNQPIAPQATDAFVIGEKLLIRTVTYFMTGRVTDVRGNFLFLEDSAWIADTGRFNEALKTGELSEVEPTGKTRVNISSIVDVFEWRHELPTQVK